MTEKEYWNNRYEGGGNSGYGSYGEQLTKKLAWLRPLEFKTITEVGCGDFNFGAHILLEHDAKYLGLDISEVIVNQNKKMFPHTFEVFDGVIPKAELLLCVDVLFHVLDDFECEKLLTDLEYAWTKYLVVTAYERDEPKDNHVRIRKFDYTRFGQPLLREVIEEDGQLYFYIFKKDDKTGSGKRMLHHERPDVSEGHLSPCPTIPLRRDTHSHAL